MAAPARPRPARLTVAAPPAVRPRVPTLAQFLEESARSVPVVELLRLLALVAPAPGEDPAEVRGDARLGFPGPEVVDVEHRPGGRPELTVAAGVYGYRGSLPAAFTRVVLTRDESGAVRALFDRLTHAVVVGRYRAWEAAHPERAYERWARESAAFPDRAGPLGERVPLLGALLGLFAAAVGFHDPGAELPPLVRAGLAGPAARGGIDAAEAALAAYFGVPVRIDTAPDAPDPAARFRITLGPLTWAEYREFVPDGRGGALVPLLRLARVFAGPHREPEGELVLRADEIPATRFGPAGARAGWTAFARRNGTTPTRDARVLLTADTCRRALADPAPATEADR